jgi:hypothetical protein
MIPVLCDDIFKVMLEMSVVERSKWFQVGKLLHFTVAYARFTVAHLYFCRQVGDAIVFMFGAATIQLDAAVPLMDDTLAEFPHDFKGPIASLVMCAHAASKHLLAVQRDAAS